MPQSSQSERSYGHLQQSGGMASAVHLHSETRTALVALIHICIAASFSREVFDSLKHACPKRAAPSCSGKSAPLTLAFQLPVSRQDTREIWPFCSE